MGRGKGAGTGQPMFFKCSKERGERGFSVRGDAFAYPAHNVVRTGRTRGGPEHAATYSRMLVTSHEYRCECGHVGWTRHYGILSKPVEGDD